MITYSYENGQISHFALKKADHDCGLMGRTIPVGVFCKSCPHFEGLKAKTDWDTLTTRHYVICSHKDNKDDDGMGDIRHEMYKGIENRALCALDY